LVSAASLVVGIVDSSKFGVIAFSAFALPHEIDRIITDDRAPASLVDALQAHDIKVDLV